MRKELRPHLPILLPILTSSVPSSTLHRQRKRSLEAGDDATANLPPEVVALQPLAVIDHSAKVADAFFKSLDGETGGSVRVGPDDLQRLLMRVGEFTTKAGGSAANTARGLAHGFDVRTALLGAVGQDEWGKLFVSSMKRSGVDTSLLAVKGEKSYTGRCVCLVDKTGQRTMRPSLEDAIRLQPEEVLAEQLSGVQWVVVNGYSYYGPGLMEATVAAARRAGCKVAMHLASFEIVRKFREPMSKLLSSGEIHAVFGEFFFISVVVWTIRLTSYFFSTFQPTKTRRGNSSAAATRAATPSSMTPRSKPRWAS